MWETTQIAAIFKNETQLCAAYSTYRGNSPGNNNRARQGRYQEINEALYKWYSLSLVSIKPITTTTTTNFESKQSD